METPMQATAELQNLLARNRFVFLQLASQILNANPRAVGVSAEAIDRAIAEKERGHSFCFEIAATERGATVIRFVSISPIGVREVLDQLSEQPASVAN